MTEPKKSSPVYVTQPLLPPLQEFIPYLQQIWESKWLTNNGPFHQLAELTATGKCIKQLNNQV